MGNDGVITRVGRSACLGAFLAAVGVAVLPFALLPTAASAGSQPAPPDDVTVAAQVLVELDGTAVQWSLTTVPVGTEPHRLVTPDAGFALAAAGDPLLVAGDSGGRWYLATGEAVVRGAGTTSTVASVGDAGGLVTIGLATPSDQDGVGGAFSVAAGPHDLELSVRTVAPAEQFTVDERLPSLLVVLVGQIGGPAGVVAAGAGVAIAGPSTFDNADSGPALVAVATATPIDLSPPDAVDDPAATPPATTVPLTIPTTSPPTTTPPATTTTAAPTTTTSATTSTTAAATTTTTPPTTAPPTTAPPTVPPTQPPADSDADGLTDSDEAAYGTNPGAYDTDGDGLGDGDEVLVYGTNPTDWDTDDDGIADPE